MDETFHHLLPASFTAPMAALLLGCSPETLYDMQALGAIAPLPGPGRHLYSLETLEKILGRPLGIVEYLAADHARESRRVVNRRYNAKRAIAAAGAPAALPEAAEVSQ